MTNRRRSSLRSRQLIVEGKTDVLTILPTGGGKSLLFFLPTLMESDMTTVVLILFLTVTQDLRDQCKNKPWVPHSRYGKRRNPLFVAVEHAVQPAFRNHLQVLYGMMVLKSLVIDEVHVLLTQPGFGSNIEKLILTLRTVQEGSSVDGNDAAMFATGITDRFGMRQRGQRLFMK